MQTFPATGDDLLLSITNWLDCGAALSDRTPVKLERLCEDHHYLLRNYASGAANMDIVLREACSNGDLNAVKFLVENGTEVRVRHIDIAAANGHANIIDYFCSFNCELVTSYAIESAGCAGRLDMVRHIHSLNPALDLSECVHYAVKHDHDTVVQYVLQCDRKYMKNVSNAAFACGKYYTQQPIDDEAILIACERGYLYMLKCLERTAWPVAALERACLAGQEEVVAFLCRRGALGTGGARLAEIACNAGHVGVLRVLALHGAPIGTPCMDLACARGHLPVVIHLRAIGAPCTPNAIEFAELFGHWNIVDYLLNDMSP